MSDSLRTVFRLSHSSHRAGASAWSAFRRRSNDWRQSRQKYSYSGMCRSLDSAKMMGKVYRELSPASSVPIRVFGSQPRPRSEAGYSHCGVPEGDNKVRDYTDQAIDTAESYGVRYADIRIT